MKKLITILLVVLAFDATAQNHGSKSNIVIMDKTGDPFYLIIDDVVQNIIPSYQLKVIGLPASYHEIKLLYKSEEHTSELQSRPHLVCRLLLEKKKKVIKKAQREVKKNLKYIKKITHT